ETSASFFCFLAADGPFLLFYIHSLSCCLLFYAFDAGYDVEGRILYGAVGSVNVAAALTRSHLSPSFLDFRRLLSLESLLLLLIQYSAFGWKRMVVMPQS
ncbi:unnamed protein product, partial [Musa acuminata subsp. burmannicoides]